MFNFFARKSMVRRVKGAREMPAKHSTCPIYVRYSVIILFPQADHHLPVAVALETFTQLTVYITTTTNARGLRRITPAISCNEWTTFSACVVQLTQKKRMRALSLDRGFCDEKHADL
jgi:hypothetical protein